VSNKGTFSFSVGDKVQVLQDIQKLKELQEGHGGWNPRMAEVKESFLNI
jgi:E3 ubiquitin-protein ligase mind-bomb